MMQLDDVVTQKVIEYTKTEPQYAHGGWHRPAVAVGTTVYLLEYEKLGGYFTYGYRDKAQAEKVIKTGAQRGANTFRYYGFNVVDKPESVIIV